MTRWLPAPWLSLLLLLVWLLLNGSLSAGQIALGLLFALGIPLALRAYLPDALRLRRPDVLLRLLSVVLLDIVLSNLTVARQILGREAALNSRFVWVPLDLREPAGIAALASIITMTPGTLSCDLSADRRHLLVHALHVADEAALIATIKARYETPLREILEC